MADAVQRRFRDLLDLPNRATERAKALVDTTLDRVFDEPFDVRTADELEELVAAGPIGNGPGPAATTLGAFVAAATPLARRALAVATKSSKVATKSPLPSSRMVKVGIASIPIAMRLSTTTRRGVRELQLLSSYVITRLRAAGVEPERGLVRALTLSLYVDPARSAGSGCCAPSAATPRPRYGPGRVARPRRSIAWISPAWPSSGPDGERLTSS